VVLVEIKTHAVLALTHSLFEVCDKSPLNRDDQVTAAVMLLELVKGSRSGYVKANLRELDATSLHRDTQNRSAGSG
jgi:hypothetical protein